MTLSSWARSLFGEEWQGPLARLLRLNKRTVQRWAIGQNPPPAEVLATLGKILDIVEQLQEVRARQEREPIVR